jgi:hypothetical protein
MFGGLYGHGLPPGLPEHLQPEKDHDGGAGPVGVLSKNYTLKG